MVGNGYLGTEVQISELEEVLQKSLGPEFHLKESDLTEKANFDGNTSLMATFSWEGKKYLLKLPTWSKLVSLYGAGAADSMAGLVKLVHNREVDFFQAILPKIPKRIVTPQFVCAKKFEAGLDSAYLVMELANGKNPFTHEFAGIEATKKILDDLAALHAVDAHFTKEEHDHFFDASPAVMSILDIQLNKDALKSACGNLAAFLGDDSKQLFEQIFKLAAEDGLVSKDQLLGVPKKLGAVQSLIHADLWRCNVLWTVSTNGEHQLDAVLDWQGWRPGNPGEDLAKLYLFALENESRKEHWAELLHYYYNQYKQYHGEKTPAYTEAQIQKAFRLSLPACALIVLSYNPRNHENDIKKGLPEAEHASAKAKIQETIREIMTEVRDILEAQAREA